MQETKRYQSDSHSEASRSQPIAQGRVKASAVVQGYIHVQDAFGEAWQSVPDLAIAVDQGGDPCVHRPGQGDPVLDRAENANGKMHVQLGRAVEPAVVRKVDEHVRLCPAADS